MEGRVGGRAPFSESRWERLLCSPSVPGVHGAPPHLGPCQLLRVPRLFFVSVGRAPLWSWEQEHSKVDFCKQTFKSFSFSPQVTAAS